MKTFKNIEDWLKTNPPAEEQKKVILLINKGAVNATRRQIWEKEAYLRKLYSLVNHFKKLGLQPPQSELDLITATKKEIEVLSKDLPLIAPRAKKEKVNVE